MVGRLMLFRDMEPLLTVIQRVVVWGFVRLWIRVKKVSTSYGKLSAIHDKGKMMEYGEICSPKQRKWKRLAKEKAVTMNSEVNLRGTKRELSNDLEDGKVTKRYRNEELRDIGVAGSQHSRQL
ncbi:hypothetical protein ACOSQ4_023194 [Xanthoceras sorbifolium]